MSARIATNVRGDPFELCGLCEGTGRATWRDAACYERRDWAIYAPAGNERRYR